MIRAITEPETLEVRNHLEALRTSSWLTTYFRRKHQPMAALVTAEKVVETLYEAGVRCVLMGTYGLGGWRSEPRRLGGHALPCSPPDESGGLAYRLKQMVRGGDRGCRPQRVVN